MCGNISMILLSSISGIFYDLTSRGWICEHFIEKLSNNFIYGRKCEIQVPKRTFFCPLANGQNGHEGPYRFPPIVWEKSWNSKTNPNYDNLSSGDISNTRGYLPYRLNHSKTKNDGQFWTIVRPKLALTQANGTISISKILAISNQLSSERNFNRGYQPMSQPRHVSAIALLWFCN